jgi:cobalt-zinc-cadmium efflux system membrane fusion protein
MVPQDAVQTLGATAWCSCGPAPARPAIQIGSRSGGMVAITGGLAAGTQIATTNAFLLKAEIEKESAE